MTHIIKRLFPLAPLILFLISNSLITHNQVTEFDASTYLNRAIFLADNNQILMNFFSSNSQFIDQGYPTILALIIRLFGKNILTIQLLNLILWYLASFFIYKTLNFLQPKSKLNYLIFLSPLFGTFSVKLYSEPLAAFGLSLIIYALVNIFSNKLRAPISLALGSIILFSTKSMFLYLCPIILLVLYFNRLYKPLLFFIFSILLLLPRIISSASGGRGEFNLAIQTAKISLTIPEITSCMIYYFSYPIGKTVFPNSEGFCHQNDPTENMPGFNKNPYILAQTLPSNQRQNIIKLIISHPIKFSLISITSLFNFFLIEGIYPTVNQHLSVPVQQINWLTSKLLYSVILWLLFFSSFKNIIKGPSLTLKSITILPFVGFLGTVVFFPVEQRYIYPLIPLIYFIACLKSDTIDTYPTKSL